MSTFETGPKTPLISSLSEVSGTALQELLNYLEMNPPTIPITQISGFAQFAAQTAREPSESTFNSPTYADPNISGAVGPELDGLSDGQYVILFGCSLVGGTGGTQQTFANFAINGVMPSDDTDAVEAQQANHASVAGAAIVTIQNDGNSSIKMVFRQPHSETVDVRLRWIIALRFANIR